MATTAYAGIEELSRIAAELHAASGAPSALPALLFMTDPERTPDPAAIAARLPEGAGIVLRHFGLPGPRMASMQLAEIAAARKLTLLIGADADLAAVVGAAGVHWPEAQFADAASYKRHQPDKLTLIAAHSSKALSQAARADADAAVLGPVFASNSPSAGKPLGADAFATLVGGAKTPVYALGGIDAGNAQQLLGSGCCGIAAIGAFADP